MELPLLQDGQRCAVRTQRYAQVLSQLRSVGQFSGKPTFAQSGNSTLLKEKAELEKQVAALRKERQAMQMGTSDDGPAGPMDRRMFPRTSQSTSSSANLLRLKHIGVQNMQLLKIRSELDEARKTRDGNKPFFAQFRDAEKKTFQKHVQWSKPQPSLLIAVLPSSSPRKSSKRLPCKQALRNPSLPKSRQDLLQRVQCQVSKRRGYHRNLPVKLWSSSAAKSPASAKDDHRKRRVWWMLAGRLRTIFSTSSLPSFK